MTGPRASEWDWSNPKPVSTSQPNPNEWGWTGVTNQQQGAPAQGFVDYIGNLAKNWWKADGVTNKMDIEKLGAPVQYDPEEKVIRGELVKSKQNGTGLGIAMNDFEHFFGKMFEGGSEQLKKIVAAPGAAYDSFKSNPTAFIGQLGKGVVKPVGDLMELNYGVSLSDNDIHALTPEMKAERIKGTVATAAMMAVGMGAAKVLAPAALSAEASTEALVSASTLTAKGALAQEALRSTAVAGIAGATYGLVSHANEADQLSEALINGVVFAPLGTAMEVLGISKSVGKRLSNAKLAGEIAQLRQAQAVFDNTLPGIVSQVEALSTSNNLAEAVMSGKMKAGDNDIIHLPGVSSETIGRMVSLVPEGFSVAHRFDADGETGLLLVYANKYKGQIDPKFFAETGYVENQVVSYGGRKEYVVTDGDSKTLDLTNVNDPEERVSVPRDLVRPTAHLELGLGADPRGLFRFSPLERDQALSRTYQEWRAEYTKPKQSPLEALKDQRAAMAGKASAIEIARVDAQITKLERAMSSTEQPIGFDDTPQSDIMNLVPDQDIAAHLNEFLDRKGYNPDDKSALKRDFEGRLAKEAYASNLDDEERALVESSHKAMEEHLNEEAKASLDSRMMDSKKLVRVANSNGMTISDGGSGRVIVRDLKSGRALAGFDDAAEAARFINRTGQADGVDLDSGTGSISGNGASGGKGLPPQGPPPLPTDFPYNFFNAPRRLLRTLASEHFIRGLDNVALLTRNREFFLNLDEKYGTILHAGIMEPTQRNANVRNQRMTPWIEELQGVEKGVRKMTPAQREQIGDWMQTMSPDQVINKFMTRKMNPLEESLGRRVAASGVDVERVFRYSRELEKLDKEFPPDTREADVATKAEYQQHVQEARAAFGIDDKHQEVVDLFNTVKGLSKRDASLGAIVRLARSITDNEVTRSEFAAKHKMTGEQLKAGLELEGLYKRLGDTFGIPAEFRLGGYMTHARLYTDGNISQALRHFSGDVQAREFFAKMARTGEISAYEKDPIMAMMRYIKGGHDAMGFNEAIANGRNILTDQLKKLPGAAQKHVRNVVERYLDDIRGFPEAGDTFAQEAVDYYVDRYKLDSDPQIRKQWVNGITALIPAATQGARVMSGITHWAMATMVSVADRGLAYTKRVHAQGAYATLHPEVLDEIRANGGLTSVSPIAAFTQAEYAQKAFSASGITNAALKSANVLFKLSGLQDVYTMLSAGHYLATKADALNALTRFGRSEIPWKQVKKELFLGKHYAPVEKQFETLVKAGKNEEAAQFLATQTVNDMVGVFGNANHPYMWGTNPGRILGEFGNWPSWLRGTVTRMASRGTAGQRIASVAKLGAMSWLGVQAGQSMGIELNRLNIMEAVGWWGGPLESVAEDVRDALKGTGYTQQQGERRLKKYLPWTPTSGFQLKQLYIPGSYAVDGMMNAVVDFKEGNVGAGSAEMLGFKTIRE